MSAKIVAMVVAEMKWKHKVTPDGIDLMRNTQLKVSVSFNPKTATHLKIAAKLIFLQNPQIDKCLSITQ